MLQYSMRKIKDIKDRFNKNIIFSDNPDDCWIWKGARNSFGYGRFGVPGNSGIYAHRFSYEMHKGKIENKLFVCHSCDNPSCVNPKHLWLGTAKDNIHDMINKNRNASGYKEGKNGKKIKNKFPFRMQFHGSSHPCSKLNEEIVKEIKIKLLKGIRGSVLAREYDISEQVINTIKHGKSWKHVII